jgi:hypothetical protein
MSEAPAPGPTGAPTGQIYRLAPAARRTVLALLLGVLAIAVYALWTVVALVGSGLSGPDWVTAALMLVILLLSPAVAWNLLAEYNTTITTDAAGLTFRTLGVLLPYRWPQVGGLTPIPAGLGRFSFGDKARSAGRTADTTGDPGDRLDTLAVPVTGTQEELRPAPATPEPGAPAGAAETDPEQILLLGVEPPAAARIANPLVRLLYRQAYAGGVPLYPGLSDRPALLAEIAARGQPLGASR